MKNIIREVLWTFKYMVKIDDTKFAAFVETVIAQFDEIIRKNNSKQS